MKKVQKLLSVLLSSLLIFTAISCANDSVDENTKPETDKPQFELPKIKDGTYTIKLNKGLKNCEYLEMDVSNNKYGKGVLKFTPGVIHSSKATITGLISENLNGEYFYYDYIIPIENKETNSEMKVSGYILSKKELSEIKVTVLNNNISVNWDEVSFNGIDVYKNNRLQVSILANKTNTFYFTKKTIIPESDKINDYIGNWNSLENGKVIYTLNITEDKKGILKIGEETNFDIIVDTNCLFGVKLFESKSTSENPLPIGLLTVETQKDTGIKNLNFIPDKRLKLTAKIITFNKAN